MDASTITVHWHEENSPIYSVDFQPNSDTSTSRSPRLATAGGDNNIRLWNISYGTTPVSINYLSTLRKHTQAVNVVKFNREGDSLASAGDDGSLILWQKSDTIVKEFGREEEEDECQESWIAKRVLRSSNSEIYDISWSPDSKYIATGSMDNVIRIYDAVKGQVHQLRDHSHYVQGISWDPLNQYLATQSADRSVNIYEFQEEDAGEEDPKPKLISKSSKATFNWKEGKPRNLTLYHSETLQSFFRRLAWSPDGSLLMVPSGIYRESNKENEKDNSKESGQEVSVDENTDKSLPIPGEEHSTNNPNSTSSEDESNSVYIYTRKGLRHSPVCHISGLKKPAIAISFSPILYEKSKKADLVPFDVPHKMVFAVATQDSVIVYDTEKLTPLGYASNLHYSSITDLVWDTDGGSLMISSTDGFCSSIVFKENVFGKRMNKTNEPAETTAEEKTESASVAEAPKSESKVEPVPSAAESKIETPSAEIPKSKGVVSPVDGKEPKPELTDSVVKKLDPGPSKLANVPTGTLHSAGACESTSSLKQVSSVSDDTEAKKAAGVSNANSSETVSNVPVKKRRIQPILLE
ncbi:chromatin assembly factor 1 subunit p60 [[Candida] railenensis]|uniref:Chromatin assembly factor 1 subunit p60 n=1 Tax=[Candida] railenensis TaxID=45579 RepID=A0A9P0QT90_9ASCO|nr:chromatin assembly factor 1 subunit p60 [[Candida] railenensis]